VELLVPLAGTSLAGYVFLGRGPGATGDGGGWFLAGHACRCARCGDFIPANIIDYFSCSCGALHIDPDYCRLGSSLGDENILVYRESDGPTDRPSDT
jgi:hypothetical protein